MSVVRDRPPGLAGGDQGREQAVLPLAEPLPGAEVADEGPVLRCPHGVPPRRATPFPKPPARPLRLVHPSRPRGLLKRPLSCILLRDSRSVTLERRAAHVADFMRRVEMWRGGGRSN